MSQSLLCTILKYDCFYSYREAFWSRSGYTSLNSPLESSSDEEEEEEERELEGEDEEREINYVVGDVTQPQNTGSNDAIIIHCVGESVSVSLIIL